MTLLRRLDSFLRHHWRHGPLGDDALEAADMPAHTHADGGQGGALPVGSVTAHDHTAAGQGGDYPWADITGFGTEPGAISSSTSGQAGTATTASRGDHNHDLGVHAHTGATDGGQHAILTAHTYTGGAALDVFGLSAASTLAKLTPSANPGAAAAILCTDAGGNLTVRYVAMSYLETASIVNAAGLAAGTYTPTITPVANVSASTAYACQYIRVGNTVTVSGKADITPTAGSTLTRFAISLPVASDLANLEQCAGVATGAGIGDVAAVFADTANNRAEVYWTCTASTSLRGEYFTFTYTVL